MSDIVKELTETFGPSGREDEVRKRILKALEGHVDGYNADNVGNLVAWKGEGGRPVMLVAHMDEIGLVVTHDMGKGFYRVEPVGGLSPYTALSRRFVFENGVVGVVSLEGESLEERKKNLSKLSFDHLYLDAFGKELDVGTFGVFDSGYEETDEYMVSKAMDDRVGCAILVDVARRLEKPSRKVYFAFSIQEEVGLVGASVVAYPVEVEEAIAVDVTDSGDTPKGIKRHAMVLGKGPAIKIKDRASISDSRIVNRLKELARSRGIPHQLEVLTFGGTDAAALMRTRSGVPSATLSIPTRYIHTPSEVVHKEDYENAVKLLLEYVRAE